MAFRKLTKFQVFDIETWASNLQLVFVKAAAWTQDEQQLGSKVTVQIMDDRNDYGGGIDNKHEQFVVKVPKAKPEDFAGLKPLQTVVQLGKIEKASLYGEFRNQISVTAGLVASKQD